MYPEHEKLQNVKVQSHACGEFLDWLRDEKKLVLSSYHQHDENCGRISRTLGGQEFGDECGLAKDEIVADYTPIPDLLAEYFEIDQRKVEEEKRQMLRELRHSHGKE